MIIMNDDVCNPGILYYVSSTLNPILYSVMSHRYRRALHDTFCSASLFGDPSARVRRCPSCFHGSDEDNASGHGYLAAPSVPRASTEAAITVCNQQRLVADGALRLGAVQNRTASMRR